MLLAFTWSLQNQMWNKHWVVINLERHLLGIPKSSLLDLNNNFVSRIPSSSDSQREIPAFSSHPLQAKSKGLLHGVLQVLSYWSYFSTLLTNLIQPPHLRFPLCSHHTELPRVPTSLPSCPSDWIPPSLLPSYMHILMPGRQAAPQHQSLASSFAFWESLCCLSSQPPGRVSHSLPGLEQDLIIHSSYNTSFILCTCLSPQQDTELLRTSLCYSFLPLAPSPVLRTSTEAFWFPEIPLTFMSCSQRTGKLHLPKINFLLFKSFW